MYTDDPLYKITDPTGLTDEEIDRVNRAKSLWEYRNNDEGLDRERRAYLARVFGISLEDYNLLFESQGNKCAICGSTKNSVLRGIPKSFPVDHDHSTDEIRGILCDRCNQGLGSFKDNISNLRKAIAYLEKTPASKLKETGFEFGANLEEFVGRRSPKERKDISTKDIIDFYQADPKNSTRKTAEKFGLSDGQVFQRLKKSGIPMRGNHKGRVCPDGTSWCSGHKDFLPVDQFWKNCGRPNGLSSQCKECRSKVQRRAYEKTKLKNTQPVV